MAKQSLRCRVSFGLSPILHGEESTMGSGGQDPAGSVADGVAWSPSSIQSVDEVEPIRHSECSENHEGARGEGDEATRSDFNATEGVFASRGGAGSRPQASCETPRSFGHVGRGGRDVPDHQGSSSEHQDVYQPETKEGRADPVGDREGEGGRAQTEQVEQQALLANGERRLEALLAKEKVSAVAFHNSTACSYTERPGRVQQVARDYR